MNPRLETYRTGAPLIVRTIYFPGGRRVHVLDPARRGKAAVRALLRAGRSDFAISHALCVPLPFVRGVVAALPGGRGWI